MAAEYSRKSGQIPAFGDWEAANELPITQYFECARQAGLLRCSCSGECGGSYMNTAASWAGAVHHYGAGFEKSLPRRVYSISQKKTKGLNKAAEQRKQVKVRDLMMDQPRNLQKHQHSRQSTKSGNIVSQKSSVNIKPVDEDLYKIPPELLENSKRKKVLGFFSRCMAPPCAA